MKRTTTVLSLLVAITLAGGGLTGAARAGAAEVLLVSEASGKLLFLDAGSPDPLDTVIAAVPLGKSGAGVVTAAPSGALAFVAHNPTVTACPQAQASWVTVVDVAAVLNDTDPANDVLANIQIARTPSAAGINVTAITGLAVSPDSARLAVSLSSCDVFSNGAVLLVDLDPASANYLKVVDSQPLSANLVWPAFRPGGSELWIPNALTIGTSGAEPGIWIRNGSTLDAVASIANFGPAEAFAGPGMLRFNASGSLAAISMDKNGWVRVFNAATRTSVGNAQFGVAAGAGCASIGTSFTGSVALSPDGTKMLAGLFGSRPFTFGCGVTTSAVHGVGFADVNATTGAMSNVGTLALAAATDGSVRFGEDLRFSTDPARAWVLTTRGVHRINVAERTKGAFLRMGTCTGESLNGFDVVAATIGAPRRASVYWDYDGDGKADTRCNTANTPPIADAGDDQTQDEGTVVTLDGSASFDPNGTAITYAWTQVGGPAVTLSDATASTPTFTAPAVGPPGPVLTFELVVNDGAASSLADTVDVTVRNVNQPPVADAGSVPAVQEGALVSLDGGLSFDPEGDGITYLWTQVAGPAVTLSDATAAAPSFTAPPVGPAGAVLTFQLVVNDGVLDSAPDTVEVAVSNVNQAPVADAGDAQTKSGGATVTLDGTQSFDPDGQAITHLWTQISGPGVTLSDPTAPAPSFTAPSVAAITALEFDLTVSDGSLTSEASRTTVTVLGALQPLACDSARPVPEIVWPPNHKMIPVRIEGLADPEGPPVTITITAVTQDEPVTGRDYGQMKPDAVIQGDRALLRAERRPTRANGRVYEMHFRAETAEGAACTGSVKVAVPLNLKPGLEAIDDGQLHDSTQQ